MSEITLGKSIETLKDIKFDFEKHIKENNRPTNIIIAGNNRENNNSILFSMLEQLTKDNEKLNVIMFTNQLEIYTKAHLTIPEEMNKSIKINDIQNYSDIRHTINRNLVTGKYSLIIADINGDKSEEALRDSLLNISILSKVHNCTVISTWNNLKDIPGNLIASSNIYIVSRVDMDDIKENNKGRLRKIGLITKKLQDRASKFLDKEYLINVDGHKVIVISEEK